MEHQNTPERLFTPELVAVIFVSAVAFYASELLNPIMPLYLSSVGLSETSIGFITSVMMAGIAVSEIFWGWVVDRVDLRIAIFVGTALLGIAILGISLVQSLFSIGVALFLYGFCRSPIYIVGRWYMGVYAPRDRIAFAMALMGAVIGIVSSIGGFTSGFLVEKYSYVFTFRLAAFIALSAGVLILVSGRWLNFQKHKTFEVVEEKQKNPKIGKNVKVITYSLGLIGIFDFIAFGVINTYLPLFATDVIGASTSQVGIIFGIRGIFTTFMTIPISRVIDKYDRWASLPIGLFIQGLGVAGMAMSKGYLGLILSMLVFSLGASIYSPTVTALLSQSVPVHWTGTAMGIFGFMEDVGWMIGPSVGGLFWVGINQPSAFWFATFITMLTIPLSYLAKSMVKKSLEVRGMIDHASEQSMT